MPDLTITVTPAQATRVMKALGHGVINPTDMTQTWVPATAAEVQTAIKVWIKQTVQRYEAAQAESQVVSTVTAETW